jgi:hypothetical protein
MSEAISSRKEVLELELDLHKAEFLALRDEILHSIDAERQALNLSLVAAGAGISVISLVDRQSIYNIILLFPFVFHVLLWEMLNTIKSLSRISSYLILTLIPRVNQILSELGREQTDVLAFGWEVHTAKESLKPSQLILTSLTPTRHWLPILAVAGLLGAYSVIIKSNNHTPTSTEAFLILSNLAFLIWAAIQNAISINVYRQKAHLKLNGNVVEVPETKFKSKRKPQA